MLFYTRKARPSRSALALWCIGSLAPGFGEDSYLDDDDGEIHYFSDIIASPPHPPPRVLLIIIIIRRTHGLIVGAACVQLERSPSDDLAAAAASGFYKYFTSVARRPFWRKIDRRRNRYAAILYILCVSNEKPFGLFFVATLRRRDRRSRNTHRCSKRKQTFSVEIWFLTRFENTSTEKQRTTIVLRPKFFLERVRIAFIGHRKCVRFRGDEGRAGRPAVLPEGGGTGTDSDNRPGFPAIQIRRCLRVNICPRKRLRFLVNEYYWNLRSRTTGADL